MTFPSDSTSRWDSVVDAIDQLTGREVEPVSQQAKENAKQLIAAIRRSHPVPTVLWGHWASVRLCWDDEDFEVEVFDDRFEAYRFFVKRTDISAYEHRPGGEIASDLLAKMEPLKLEKG